MPPTRGTSYKCLAEDAPLHNQHAVEGEGDLVHDADQLGQHPLLRHRLQRVQLNRAGLSNEPVELVSVSRTQALVAGGFMKEMV